MEKGDFKPVTKNKKIIGFIYLRYDGAYEAIAPSRPRTRRDTLTVQAALDTEHEARLYIQRKYNNK